MDQLTEAEAAFFQTGEISPDLAKSMGIEADPAAAAPESAPAPADPPAPPAAIEPIKVNDRYADQLIQQERQRGEELERALGEMRKQLESMKAPVAPDPNADPLGALMYKMDQMANQIKAIQDGATAVNQQQQQIEAQNRFVTSVNGLVNDFKKDHTDYDAAYKHLREHKFDELKTLGYSTQEAEQRMAQEETDLIVRASKAQRNPAEIAYGLAQKYGYKAPAAPSNPSSKIDEIKKGLKADALPANGKPSEDQVTLDNLKNASDDDLVRAVSGDGWEKLFGTKSAKDIF